jgi:hypothetical protein
MLRRSLWLAALALALLPLTAAAQEKPSAETVQEVVDFYYNGEGVVLSTVQICEDVPTSGDDKYGCTGETDPASLQTGTQYDLRMVFLVPQDQSYDNLLVQYNRGGITRATDDVSVSGSIRYRTWEQFSFDQAGEWTIKILHDRGDTVETLREITVTAGESSNG